MQVLQKEKKKQQYDLEDEKQKLAEHRKKNIK